MATAGQLVKRNWFCGILLIALVVGAGSLAEEDEARKKRDEAVEALRDVGGVFTFAKELSKAPVELTFTGHRLSDLHLVQLRALPSLRVLDFNANQNVTDMGYLFLQSLPELRTLNLGGTRITNTGLVSLKKLKKLETLHLWLTTISDEGLLHLTELPNLKMLNLWDAHISDEGLKHLAKMKSLRRLCIGRSLDRPVNLPIDDPVAMNLITDEGVRNLQKALPDTKIFLWNAAGKPLAKGERDPRIESKPKPAANVPKRQEVAVRDIGSRPGVDWPSFLGPTSNSKSSEKGILTRWPKAGPKIVWQKPIGDSHSAPAISKGRLFFFDRVEDTARVTCLKSETGELLWTFETPTDYIDQIGYGNGPRCSPVVDGDRVYAYGAEGMLYCLSVLDGQELWRVDTVKQFGVVQLFFGVGSTPVVEGELLIVVVGGSPAAAEGRRINLDFLEGNGTGIVAFDKFTGAVRYALSDQLASYATAKLATIGDRRWGFAFCRGALVGFDPANGKIDFEFPWKAKFNAAVSAATPVVVDDHVFISESYGPGGCLLKVRPGGCDVVWQDELRKREKAMQTHWNTPVYHDGYLYASSGRHSSHAELRCIEWKTGRIMWSELTQSRSSFLFVDDHFVVLGEYGQLMLVKANPKNFEPVAAVTLREDPRDDDSPQLLKYPAWSAPVLSHGLLYVRGKDRLVCLELILED